MKIRRLSLENYKSYKNATINFDEGINCILGKNGAGKSTIIEAIGTTLFNYDIRKSQFQVRYGEKTAKLELEYEGKDGTIYIITKKIGNNSSVKIKNLNTNEIIENTSNVYTYVKETLGIKQERSLPEMYKEIIAVPQGEFVSVFLETEAERKKKIDNLFNLDISATECFISPILGLTYLGSKSLHNSSLIILNNLLIEISLPEAIFKAPVYFVLQDFIFALTTLSTWIKSLVWSPSPYIIGCSLFKIEKMNFGITEAYCEVSSCLGPNTLKYLSAT